MRGEIDPDTEVCTLFNKVGVGAYQCFWKSKKIMVVDSREFLMDCMVFEQPDGTCIHLTSSNKDLYSKRPLSKNSVRAETPISGWILTPDKRNPNKTWATLIMELNFGGYIPDFAVRGVFKECGYTIANLRKAMPKFC